MQIDKQKFINSAKKALILAVFFVFLVTLQVLAANTPTFSQAISAGSLSMDIVDAGGNSVGSPSVTFGSKSFSFATQDSTGSFAPSAQRLRVSNATATAAWVVNLAGIGTTASWTSGSDHYDFNDAGGYTDDGSTTDADDYAGQMTVDPSGGDISGLNSCSTTNTSKGASDSFVEGSVDSIDIFSSTTAATYCQFEYIGAAANITQKIPAGQKAGSYSLSMMVSVQ